MGSECIPPEQMFYAKIHPLLEMWIFVECGEFRYQPRWRWNNTSWWSGRMSRTTTPEPKNLEEAKVACLALMQEELSLLIRRGQKNGWAEDFPLMLQQPLDLQEIQE